MTTQEITSRISQKEDEFSQDMWDALDNAITELADREGALIPILQSAQNIFEYLPSSVLHRISKALNISYSQVAGVVSFYSYFSTVPRGKHIIRVCLGTACYVRGGKEVLSALQKELAIEVGETTEDRQFSLEIGRCFGACGLAPVVMIDDTVFQRVKPAKIRSVLDPYRIKEDENEK